MIVSNGGRKGSSGGPLADGMPSIITAAHELKSPLALIRQLSLVLSDDSLSAVEKNRILSQITLTSERALRLTSDLTKSVRLTEAMFKLEPINPHKLCEDIINDLQPLFNAKNKELRLTGNKHPLLLIANRDLLRRIITNFSDNALNYSGKSKIIEIKIGSLKKGSVIRLAVRDYGPSIPSGICRTSINKTSVFNAPINTRPQSSGLGLYISEQFASAMNGEIGITRHRLGASFYIDLQSSQQLSLL